jgi:hypothetical protein
MARLSTVGRIGRGGATAASSSAGRAILAILVVSDPVRSPAGAASAPAALPGGSDRSP